MCCFNICVVCEWVMFEKLGYWNKFYLIDELEVVIYCVYSYSDCICYYWFEDEIKYVVEILFVNLEV